jgi:hypothetical protein
MEDSSMREMTSCGHGLNKHEMTVWTYVPSFVEPDRKKISAPWCLQRFYNHRRSMDCSGRVSVSG